MGFMRDKTTSLGLIVVFILLSACQTSSVNDHVWTSDLAAKDVVDGKFTLQGQVRMGEISRLAESAPVNTERAIELSFRSNEFLASDPSDAQFQLDATILEVAESLSQRSAEMRVTAEKLKISDQAVIVLNQYALSEISSRKIVRNLTVLTVYDPNNYDDGILISCLNCNQANLPSLQSSLNPTPRVKQVSSSPPIKSSYNASGANALDYRPVTKEAQLAGAIATILVVGILSGGTIIPQFYGTDFSGGQPPYGVAKYEHSIRVGRAFKNNVRGAIKVLSMESL